MLFGVFVVRNSGTFSWLEHGSDGFSSHSKRDASSQGDLRVFLFSRKSEGCEWAVRDEARHGRFLTSNARFLHHARLVSIVALLAWPKTCYSAKRILSTSICLRMCFSRAPGLRNLFLSSHSPSYFEWPMTLAAVGYHVSTISFWIYRKDCSAA